MNLNFLDKKKMPYRLANIDFQMLTLNAVSGTALITESIKDNVNVWTVGILVVSIAALNFAKAYSTVKKANKNEEDETK